MPRPTAPRTRCTEAGRGAAEDDSSPRRAGGDWSLRGSWWSRTDPIEQ
jgi:hypothetical protein